jgi:polysaccharide biosynthesis/export protein
VRNTVSQFEGSLIRVLVLLLFCARALCADSGDYQVGSDDLLKVNVFDHPELSVEARVSKSGNITFPLLGELKVAGLTPRQLEQLLTSRLDQGGYVHHAQVSVLITDYQSQKVAVVGQVAKPGQYALTTSSRVLDLLAQAGGPVTTVAADEGTLVRHDGTRVSIDLHALFQGDLSQNPPVGAGDSIYVPRAPQFYIYGEVQRPGPYRLERQMTVAQAISTGGGLTPKGSLHFMKVKRRDAGGALREIPIKERDLLRADDVLMIKQSWF